MAIERYLQDCALFLTQSTHHSDGQQGCERDVSAEDAVQVTVLSIAALKKVSKGTRVLLLDRNGAQSKQIAKALAKKGFKKVITADCMLYQFWNQARCSSTSNLPLSRSQADIFYTT